MNTSTEMGRFGRGVISTLVPNIVAALLSAAIILVVLRASSPGEWGATAAYVSVAQMLGGILDMGASSLAIRNLAKPGMSSKAAEEFNRISIARLTVWRLLIMVGTVIWLLPWAGFSWWIVLLAGSTFLNIGASVRMIADGHFLRAAALSVLDKLTALIVVGVASVVGVPPADAYPAALALGVTASAFVALASSGVRTAFIWPLYQVRFFELWRGAGSFGVANNAPTLLLLDVAIVSAFAGSAEAGIFALGARLVAPLSIAAGAIARVALPFFSYREVTMPARRTVVKATAMLSVVLLGLVVLLVLADWWIPLLFGPAYEPAVWPARLYILNVMVVIFTRTFATFLQAQGRERAVSVLISVSTILALILIALGAMLGGAFGASFGVLLSNVLLIVALVRYTAVANVLKKRN